MSLVGPKSRANAVDDGQPVNIPAPVGSVITEGGTLRNRPSPALVVRGFLVVRAIGKSVALYGRQGEEAGSFDSVNRECAGPRKASREDVDCPYRKPTQVGR